MNVYSYLIKEDDRELLERVNKSKEDSYRIDCYQFNAIREAKAETTHDCGKCVLAYHLADRVEVLEYLLTAFYEDNFI